MQFFSQESWHSSSMDYSPLVAEYLLNRHNTLLQSLFALISFIET